MEFGPFSLDPSAKSLYLNDEFVPLTPKSAALLCLLVEEPGRLVTKDEILQRVWKDAYVEEGSLSNNVWALRKQRIWKVNPPPSPRRPPRSSDRL